MPLIRRCFLCDYKYDRKSPHIMMHSFPTCSEVKQQWIKVCNILPNDDVTNLYVCSQHFRPEDYYKPHSSSTKYKLNIGAIPSRKVINTVGTDFENSFDLPSTTYNERVTEMEDHAEFLRTSETTIDLPSTIFKDGQSTPKKRRFVEPRYINEISPSHVSTPRKAKRVIDMVKRNYKHQANKIKQLQDATHLLHKKVQTLEEMVAHLKQKN